MKENEITYDIRGAAFKVYNKLGPGLLESVYEHALAYEFRKMGHEVKTRLEFLFFMMKLDLILVSEWIYWSMIW